MTREPIRYERSGDFHLLTLSCLDRFQHPRAKAKVIIVLVMAFAAPWLAQAERYNPADLPKLLGSELLVEAYLPDRFLFTTEEMTFQMQEDQIGLGVFPSISTDGSIVASAHRLGGACHARRD
jgi:hypothetical protein